MTFTPVDGVPNSSVTTGFTLNLTDRAAGKSANKAATSVVDSDPIVTVVQIDDHYELKAVSSGTGPLIELNGSPVTVGQFPAGWTPVGATETGDGYEIAWSAHGAYE